jgi:5-formyltetrahydrofolate cyclo-ligase
MEPSIARNLPGASATHPPQVDPGKAALRASLLAARRALPSDAQCAAALTERLGATLATRPAVCVALYWPVAGEPDPRPALAAWLALAPERMAALPVVVAPRTAMQFHRWRPDAAMREGRYGIPVPVEAQQVRPDLLLVPCVGFDADGFRLGYGGGYYDRTLAALSPRPATLGIAWECGRVATLPRQAHDIPLDAVLTERRIYTW